MSKESCWGDYSRVTHSRARFMAFSEARELNVNQINSTCMKSLNIEEIKVGCMHYNIN